MGSVDFRATEKAKATINSAPGKATGTQFGDSGLFTPSATQLQLYAFLVSSDAKWKEG
jgi:hypothetical protein